MIDARHVLRQGFHLVQPARQQLRIMRGRMNACGNFPRDHSLDRQRDGHGYQPPHRRAARVAAPGARVVGHYGQADDCGLHGQ